MPWKEVLGTEVLWLPSCHCLILTALASPSSPKRRQHHRWDQSQSCVLDPALQPQGCPHLLCPQSPEAVQRALLNAELQFSVDRELIFIKDTHTQKTQPKPINIKI